MRSFINFVHGVQWSEIKAGGQGGKYMLLTNSFVLVFLIVNLVSLIVILRSINDLKNLLGIFLIIVLPSDIALISSNVKEFLGTPENTENSFFIPVLSSII